MAKHFHNSLTFSTGVKRKSQVHGKRLQAAFHRVDLLVCISLVLLLGALGVAAFSRGEIDARLTKCQNNLRQLGQASTSYGLSNSGNTPPAFPFGTSGGAWPWDMSASTANTLVSLGARRENFYCPTIPNYYNTDLYWFFTPSFKVLGYAFATYGSPRVLSTEIVTNFAMPNPESRPYIMDAILSSGSNTSDREANVYTNIIGAFPSSPHGSAHVRGHLPTGGNLMMLDGHVEWRGFERMTIRTSGTPSFWW